MFSKMHEGINCVHADEKVRDDYGRGRVVGIRERPIVTQDEQGNQVESSEIHVIVAWENQTVPVIHYHSPNEIEQNQDFDSYEDFNDDDDNGDSEEVDGDDE